MRINRADTMKQLILESFTSDSSSEKDVLFHDGDSVGVDGAHVGVFEETNEVGFRSLLEGKNGGGLETGFSSDFVSDLLNESLERKLSDQKVGGLLILADFASGDCAGAETVRFLDASGGRRLLGSLGVELLSGLLDSCGALSGGGFGSCHFVNYELQRLL